MVRFKIIIPKTKTSRGSKKIHFAIGHYHREPLCGARIPKQMERVQAHRTLESATCQTCLYMMGECKELNLTPDEIEKIKNHKG